MDFAHITETLIPMLAAFGFKLLGAVVAWFIGRYLISLAGRLIAAAMSRETVDPTLVRYARNIVNVALNVVLIVAILGYFGVETTSFAALVAAMGIAIGAAWAGLLANFAAGAFLVLLRPFKVGDYVRVGGIEGSVKEIGLFATTVLLPDNVAAFVGNNKIFSETIQNFSATPYRRVDRTAQLAHSVDVNRAMRELKEALKKIPNIVESPEPVVEILDFTVRGPVLAVRTHALSEHYWQVYFDMNRAIVDTFGEAGYPVPEDYMRMRQLAAAS